VLSDYLTGKMEWGDLVGRVVRDSTPDNQRVGTGGFLKSDHRPQTDKTIFK